jgi:hypothetical protein
VRRGGLNQPRQHHRLDQEPAVAERQVLVDIGDAAEMLGHEALARQTAHHLDESLVDHLVGAQLVVHHVLARLGIRRCGHAQPLRCAQPSCGASPTPTPNSSLQRL